MDARINTNAGMETATLEDMDTAPSRARSPEEVIMAVNNAVAMADSMGLAQMVNGHAERVADRAMEQNGEHTPSRELEDSVASMDAPAAVRAVEAKGISVGMEKDMPCAEPAHEQEAEGPEMDL